jgi:Cu/Ag efflux protein CusF
LLEIGRNPWTHRVHFESDAGTAIPEKDFFMMVFSKWIATSMAVALMASPVLSAETVASGKVKSIDASAKTFILSDGNDKEFTFSFGDTLLVNREGKESKSDLKAGDPIYICYDKGLIYRTAHYILVQEGEMKNSVLVRGNIKSFDASKKEITFTNEEKKDVTYSMGEAKVRFNREEAKIENITIGEPALLIVDMANEKSVLRCVMVDRAKTN